jgi:hypothetical protein
MSTPNRWTTAGARACRPEPKAPALERSEGNELPSGNSSSIRYALFVALFTACLHAVPCSAQAQRHFEDEAVIVLVDDADIPSGNGTILRQTAGAPTTRWIVRFPSGNFRNVIALRTSTATSGLLLQSIRVLQSVQASKVATPVNLQVMGTAETLGAAPDESTRALFFSLQHAPLHQVPRIGRVRAVSIRLK